MIQMLTIIMNSHMELGDLESMQKTVEVYLSLGLPPRPSLFNVILKKYEMNADAENAKGAIRMVEKMKNQGILPNNKSFQLATSAAMRANDVTSARKLLEQAKSMGRVPSVIQYMAILRGNVIFSPRAGIFFLLWGDLGIIWELIFFRSGI
jgi:ABC-type antimicrobial peptide transport system ATPase subunit